MGVFGDPAVKSELSGRTEDQQSAILYFTGGTGGMLGPKPITDAEYDALVRAKLAAVATMELALEKLGLLEEQTEDMNSVRLEGWYYSKQGRIKRGEDRILRSSGYQVSWFFFSTDQMFAYQHTFNMDDDTKKTRTENYFYRDVISFSTQTNTVEYEQVEQGGLLSQQSVYRDTDDENVFRIVVPGDVFEACVTQSDYSAQAIRAMQKKLRTTKSQIYAKGI